MFQPAFSAYNSIFFFLIKNIIEPGGVASAAHLLKPDVWIFLFYKCSFFFFFMPCVTADIKVNLHNSSK